MSDVLIGKQQSLERCLLRVRQAWAQPSTLPFEEDYDKPFIGWLFVSLNKRIDNLTVRIDKLYELLAAERKP